MPQVTNASNPKVTKAGYKNCSAPSPTTSRRARPADYALTKLGAKKAAVVHDKQPSARASPKCSARTSPRAVAPSLSFSGIARPMSTSAPCCPPSAPKTPDVVYSVASSRRSACFVKQARELGIKATFFAADSAFTPDFIAGAGPASEGAVVSFQAPPYDSSPALQKFAADYKAAFGEDPGPYSPMALSKPPSSSRR